MSDESWSSHMHCGWRHLSRRWLSILTGFAASPGAAIHIPAPASLECRSQITERFRRSGFCREIPFPPANARECPSGNCCPRADKGRPTQPAPSELEFDALRQGQLAGPIERVSLAAHVGLPGVAARFASAAGLLLAAEGAADFGAAGADVDIGDAAIAAAM